MILKYSRNTLLIAVMDDFRDRVNEGFTGRNKENWLDHCKNAATWRDK